MKDLLLTERETEKTLKMSRSSIVRLVAQGKLRPLKIGRSLRFIAEDVASYVETLKEEQQEAAEDR